MPLIGLEVPLAIEELILVVDQGEGVRAVAVHVTVPVGDAAIGEKDRHLVKRLRRERPENPTSWWPTSGWNLAHASACG